MKQKISTLIMFCFALSFYSYAQITLNLANFPLKSGDTIRTKFIDTTKTTLTAPTTGAAQTWDYSGVALKDSVINTVHTTVTDTGYTTANLLTVGPLSLFSGFKVPVSYYERLDATGFATLGRKTPAASASLSAITTLADSLIVSAANNVYSSPQYDPKFSVAYNNASYTFANRTANPFKITNVIIYGDLNFSYVNLIYDTVTVAGYGTLKVPNPTAGGSPLTLNVLLVKTRQVSVDSFTSPTLTAATVSGLLSQINLTQGARTTSDTYEFFALNGRTSILKMTFPANNLTKPQGSYAYQDVSKITPTSEPLVENVSARFFPNPVINNSATISFQKMLSTDWRLMIVNQLGQIVSVETISGNIGFVNHPINTSGLTSGIYNYVLLTGEGQLATSGKFLIQK